jgi:extracellular factor (EF) 3-hydroxypalmitic acid methyl ester biosynthesis protein
LAQYVREVFTGLQYEGISMAMLKVLKYLKDDEYLSLLQTAESKTFKPGALLIRQGEQQTNLYVLVKGSAKVVRDHDGFMVDISQRGPGEIFGDMSFIEGHAASASVEACDPEVQAIIITHANIKRLIEADPTFAGRFYKSLAEILSRRLRDTTDTLDANQSPEEVWGNP